MRSIIHSIGPEEDLTHETLHRLIQRIDEEFGTFDDDGYEEQ